MNMKFKTGYAFLAMMLILASQSASARNPLKDSLIDLVPGGPGNPAPGSSATQLTLGGYELACPGAGYALSKTEAKTVNRRRQLFLHQEAVSTGGSNDVPIAVGTFAYLSQGGSYNLNIFMQNPITFQMIAGEGAVISIYYTYAGRPNQFVSFAPAGGVRISSSSPLIKTGNNTYAIPVGLGPGVIPRGSTLTGFSIGTVSDPKNRCKLYISDINNLQIGGMNVGITTENEKSCGSPCSD